MAAAAPPAPCARCNGPVIWPTIITALAGEVGEESEVLEVTIRMPIPETPLHVTGNLTLEVAHTAAGFEVSCEPRLGLGLGSGDDNADLMAGSRIEVTGHDAATAAALVLVAMDHQLRAVAAGGVPPALVAILIAGGILAPEVTAVVVIADLVGRMANWASTGEPSDPVLLWLADLMFGAGHIGRVARRMTGEDSVETVDSVAVEAEGGEGTGAHRRDVAVGLATGAHWGLEAEDGEVVESEFRTIDLHFDANFPPWHGSVEAHFPITRGEHVPRGSIEIEMAVRTEITSAETYLEARPDRAARPAHRPHAHASPQRGGRDHRRGVRTHDLDGGRVGHPGQRGPVAHRQSGGGRRRGRGRSRALRRGPARRPRRERVRGQDDRQPRSRPAGR